MPTLAELQQRLNKITTESLPTIKAQLQSATQRREQAHEELKSLGWDGQQDLTAWLQGLVAARDAKLAEVEAALKEAEDALAAASPA